MTEFDNVILFKPREADPPHESAELPSAVFMGSKLRWSTLYEAAKDGAIPFEYIPSDVLSSLRAKDPDSKPRIVPPPEA